VQGQERDEFSEPIKCTDLQRKIILKACFFFLSNMNALFVVIMIFVFYIKRFSRTFVVD
jgi:hypothetical protein